MSSNRPLTSAQQQVLALIAAGSTARAAADAAGVHRNTVANWLCLSEFRQAIAQAQYDKALFFREQAESLAAEAHNAIRAMLADPAVPASVRLKAALAMLDRAAVILPARPDQPPAPDHPPVPLETLEIVHKNAQNPPENAPLRSEPKFPPAPASPALAPPSGSKIGRNDTCPCGSGMKFKRCCLGKTAAPALRPALAIRHAG
jgi:SEC-C motif